jgi:hypothetical protein
MTQKQYSILIIVAILIVGTYTYRHALSHLSLDQQANKNMVTLFTYHDIQDPPGMHDKSTDEDTVKILA